MGRGLHVHDGAGEAPGGPVVREEFGVQGAQFGPGIRAEAFREGRAHLLVRRQGLGRPARVAEGADPQGPEGVVEGLLRGELAPRRVSAMASPGRGFDNGGDDR